MIGSKIYVSVVGILVIWFVWQGQRTMAQYLWIMKSEGKFKKHALLLNGAEKRKTSDH